LTKKEATMPIEIEMLSQRLPFLVHRNVKF
jgi:hypothetical protein